MSSVSGLAPIPTLDVFVLAPRPLQEEEQRIDQATRAASAARIESAARTESSA